MKTDIHQNILIIAISIAIIVTISLFFEIILKNKDEGSTGRQAVAQSNGSAKTTENHSIGFKLLVIEGQYGLETDMRVKRYNSLIRQLDEKYVETPERIADITVRARQLLAEEGIDVTHGDIMIEMNLIFTQEHDNMQYAEYVALYVAQRKKGRWFNYNHR